MAKKKPYRFILYFVLRGMSFFVYALPRPIALWLAERAGRLSFWAVLRQRRKTLENLSFAYGQEKSPQEIHRIAAQVFENLALTGVEVLQFSKLSRQKIEKIVDAGDALKRYDQILAEGKGLISMTAHLGNWELLAAAFAVRDYKGAVLARKIYYEPYNRWIVGLRASLKVSTIYRDDSSREILKVLQRNEIIGLLPDQDMDSMKGIFVPFFGHPAYTTVAPARLAAASGAPMLPNFMVRVNRGSYKVVVGEVIRPPQGLSRDEAVLRMTEDWMRQFENMIRRYPGQWAWMHNRWKTKPDNVKQNSKESAVTQ